MWELGTRGQYPHQQRPGKLLTDDFVFPKCLYDIIVKCWQMEANDRPKFADICIMLSEMLYSPKSKLWLGSPTSPSPTQSFDSTNSETLWIPPRGLTGDTTTISDYSKLWSIDKRLKSMKVVVKNLKQVKTNNKRKPSSSPSLKGFL